MVLTVSHAAGEQNPLSGFSVFHGSEELLITTAAQNPPPKKGACIRIGTRMGGPVMVLFPTDHLNMMTYGAYDKNEFNVSNPHNIYEPNGSVIGTITKLQKSVSTSEAPRYAAYLPDCSYMLYPIELGKLGVKMPVFNEADEQIACITRPLKDKKELNRYTIHLFDLHYTMLLTAFITYIDAMEFVDKGAALPSISFAKSAKERYSYEFEKSAEILL